LIVQVLYTNCAQKVD